MKHTHEYRKWLTKENKKLWNLMVLAAIVTPRTFDNNHPVAKFNFSLLIDFIYTHAAEGNGIDIHRNYFWSTPRDREDLDVYYQGSIKRQSGRRGGLIFTTHRFAPNLPSRSDFENTLDYVGKAMKGGYKEHVSTHTTSSQ